jgi:hypothetical protein
MMRTLDTGADNDAKLPVRGCCRGERRVKEW